jgi:hypothetical protein
MMMSKLSMTTDSDRKKGMFIEELSFFSLCGEVVYGVDPSMKRLESKSVL